MGIETVLLDSLLGLIFPPFSYSLLAGIVKYISVEDVSAKQVIQEIAVSELSPPFVGEVISLLIDGQLSDGKRKQTLDALQSTRPVCSRCGQIDHSSLFDHEGKRLCRVCLAKLMTYTANPTSQRLACGACGSLAPCYCIVQGRNVCTNCAARSFVERISRGVVVVAESHFTARPKPNYLSTCTTAHYTGYYRAYKKGY